MEAAALPENEDERLAELLSYDVLDTEAEQLFDDLTTLASQICETPIALISLIDPDRQWFKSRVGLDAEETSREIAFCSHAILQEEVFEIPNATLDPRFHDNPLVTGSPDIR
ncbi:sensor protein, partial [marine sediment metagenome]